MPRPSNTAARRQQIVEGLMAAMATSGYSGASIPLIAKAAGLTPGLVHYHFGSKQEILIELVRHLMDLVAARLTTTAASKPAARLSDYIDAHLAQGEGANPAAVACWVTIGAEAINQSEVRDAFQKATARQLQQLEGICEEVLKAEKRTTSKRREIALGITAAIEGAYRLTIGAPDLIPYSFAAPTIKTMAQGLISAQPLDVKH